MAEKNEVEEIRKLLEPMSLAKMREVVFEKLTSQKIKKIRLKSNLTVSSMAQKLGVTWITVQRWETGVCIPSLLSHIKILTML
jgi:DNA-binding transcriptional regulator YiaG